MTTGGECEEGGGGTLPRELRLVNRCINTQFQWDFAEITRNIPKSVDLLSSSLSRGGL